jgi:eukaryotic-like serine/threonine-protein kinase
MMKDQSANPKAGEAETIFNAALAFTAAERPIYLAGACRDNLPLRQRVEALLRAHEAPQGFLPDQPDATVRSTIAITPISEMPGTVIGRYKLLQQIGEGGCGVVYMAEQQEPVRRRVALKVIKLGMDTKQVIARFEAERQALALMDHPNIAKVLDAGATETGRPYFVMELVKGIPITRFCDENNLSTATRLNLFVQVCHAIQHAHQKGIIHRDIKPSNILVADHDGVPVPKIIDFGIAKATTDQRLTDKTLFTAFEQFIGTPAYMSPEQAKLSGLDVDTRSDIYSLGVLLYELLTGKTPFEGKRLLEAGLDEIRRIIREEEPMRPSTRLHTLDAAEQTTVARHRQSEAPKLVHLIRGDLDWIVMKALEKDRGRRYETANGLAMDIQRHLQNEPVTACPPGNLYRFQKMVRRNTLTFGAAAAVAISLILGLAISSFLFIREKEARASEAIMRRQAEDAKKQAQTQAARAEAASLDAKSAEQKAREKEMETKTVLSAAEFLQGSRAISEKHPADALAYLARSFSDDPGNAAALTSMATLLASHSWMAPTVLLQPANSAQFSPDGERIVTASDYGTARVWDAQSGQPLTGPMELGHKVNSAQFSPDGKRIVTASWDQARVWDAQSGQPLTAPMKHRLDSVNSAQFSPNATAWDPETGKMLLSGPWSQDNGVSSAHFSPDGTRIVTACDTSAWLWDAQSGRQLTELKQQIGFGGVISAQFSPDGTRIVTTAWDRVRIWDAQSGKPLADPLEHGSRLFAQFSPAGNRIVTASDNGAARVWDAQSGRPLTKPMQHLSAVTAAQFSPDGKRILTATQGGTVRFWDAESGKLLPGPANQDNRVNSAQFSPDGNRIVTASGTVARVWDGQSGKPLTEPMQHDSVVNSAQFSPDGKRVLTASRDGTVRVWDALNGRPPLAEFFKNAGRLSAQFSPDGTRILTVSGDSARVWDARSHQPLTAPVKHNNEVVCAQFSADGKRIVTASADTTARVWDAQSGRPLTDPLKHVALVKSAQFSPDGKRVLTASFDSRAQVWDAQSGQPLLTAPLQHSGPVNCAQFSPDGNRIVTASGDKTARVWDAQSGQPMAKPMQHQSVVNSAQFSPDGRRILTASEGQGAQVWDAQSGQPLMQLGVEAKLAQFSPDGKRILTATGNTARLWDAQSGQLLTAPLQHTSAVSSAQFSADGKRIVTAAGTAARVWDAQTGELLMEPLSHGRPPRPGEFKPIADSATIRGATVSGVIFPVNSAQFSPDGKRVVTAADDGNVRVWDIAPSPESSPAWLAQLAEAICGQTLNKQGLLEPSRLNRADILNHVRQELNRAPDTDDWAVWGRWFLADSLTRTISPFSRQTVPEYIEDRIKEATPEALDEAERLAANKDTLLKRIAEARTAFDQTTRAHKLKLDADALVKQGKFAEAEPMYREALEIIRNHSGPNHPDTVRATSDLADFYYAVGRSQEALALQTKVCELDPHDTFASLALATWQAWFGQNADYEATRRRLLQQALGTDQAGERAAKAACLRPSTDVALLANALKLAQRAVDFVKDHSYLPWCQLSLGMSEYRNGQYAAAEQSLKIAEQTAGETHEISGIAQSFLAMNLFRQNRSEEARKVLSQAEAQMPPLPKDESKPLVDGAPVSHDVLIWWLAYKEAKSVLNETASAKP